MGIQIEFDSTCGILKAQIIGKFDTDEYREVMVKLTSSTDYPATVPTIWDLRKLDLTDLNGRLGRYVSEIRSSFKKRGAARIAYVISNQLGYGLMRMFQVLTDTEGASLVCYEYDDAERWIKQGIIPSSDS